MTAAIGASESAARPGFTVRAIEVHDFAQIWNAAAMHRRLQFMAANGLNTLVLHEPGIVDKIVFPAIYLGGRSAGANFFEISRQLDANITKYAMREFQNAFRRPYLTQLIADAAALGIAVYLEDKELWFEDFVLRSHPEAFQNGFLCPSRSFWWEEFLPAKYKELFVALPQLAGVVISSGTGEARLSLSNIYNCQCDLCRNLDPVAWHRNVVLGMYGAFKAAGKKLVIRDFVFTKEQHDQFAQALEKLPLDIALALKNTPHDFYPTFPDNPLIGQVGEREQWIEYDVHGQYFGWGMAPAIMIDDLVHRLGYAREHKVTGFVMRTDWEGTQSNSCFDTPNLINLYAAAMIAQNPAVERRRIYERWLTREDLVATPQRLASCTDWAMAVFDQTWPAVRGTVFVNGTVFSDSGAFHVYLRQSTWIAETLHSLKDWSAGAETALQMQDANARKILDEKAAAVVLASRLYSQVMAGNPGLRSDAYDDLVRRVDFLRRYSEAFQISARIYVFSRMLEERGAQTSSGFPEPPRQLLAGAVGELRAFRERFMHSPFARIYPANALLDPDRLSCFIQDAETRLAAAPR